VTPPAAPSATAASAPRALVIFDFDGTLADTWRDIADALNAALLGAGHPRVEAELARFWIGSGVLPLLRHHLGEGAGTAALQELYTAFAARYEAEPLQHTGLYAGVREALDALCWARLAIVSNKPAAYLQRLLGELQIGARFELALGGDSLAWRKPDPRLVEHVARRSAEPPGRIWVVGDSAVDIELGRAAGAATVGCAWGLRGRAELVAARADHVIEHPSELAPLIGAGAPTAR
jgi:phosphoglycolate phosphatase